MRALWSDPGYRLRVLNSRARAQLEKDLALLRADRYNLDTWDWFDRRLTRRRARIAQWHLEATPPGG